MKFNNATEMYNYLINEGDLYNKNLGYYVFAYNDTGAICMYQLKDEEMLDAAKRVLLAKENHVSAVLGAGGVVFVLPEYEEYKYSDKRELYLQPSMVFCKSNYSEEGWAPEGEYLTLALIETVEELNNNTPDGTIVDADTFLVDRIEECDYKFSGISQDIFNIWKNSNDKKSVEEMFYEFTDVEFVDYLRSVEAVLRIQNCQKE